MTNKRFVLVNVIGLSVGLMVSILIMVYVRYETSFDNFNPNGRNIYRIAVKNLQDGSTGLLTPIPLADVLKSDYPEIDKVVGLMRIFDDINADNKRFENLRGALVEKDFFKMFRIPLSSGNNENLFDGPYEAVITRDMAAKVYGNADPIGKTFTYEDFNFTITGLVEKIPSNSIFNFDYFISDKFKSRYYPDLQQRWYNFGMYAFVTFKGTGLPEAFEQKLTTIEQKYYPELMKNRGVYKIFPFKGSHVTSLFNDDLVTPCEPGYLWILSAIAIAILVIACLNFMNITIADISRRSVAAAIKKVNGASSQALVRETFTEICILVLICLVLAIYLAYLLVPAFNNIAGKNISIDFSDPLLILLVAGFGLLTALLTGLYPSIMFAVFSPAGILLRARDQNPRKFTFQKSFLVMQYVITIALAISQIFIFRQIRFMQNHDTGFKKDNLISISVNTLGNNSKEKLRNTEIFAGTLTKYQYQYGYGKSSVTEFVPGFGFRNRFKIFPDEKDFPNGLELLSCDVDENFLEVFGLHMIEGRFFSIDHPTDKEALLINESAFKKLGWDNVDGKSFGLFERDYRKNVIGVINDINVKSMQYPVEPMIYQFGSHHNYPGYITLRIDPARYRETLEFLRKTWSELFPEAPFKFETVTGKFIAAYGEEKRLSGIITVFSVLAMILSLLGIYALSSLEAEKRTKEIGIRKINGAGVTNIMTLMNIKIIRWVIIAFIIAIPVAFLAVHSWLGRFAYKTEISWWIFIFTGSSIILIALATISIQSLKIALRNPVTSLRQE